MASVFIALDPATRKNGCLQVLRGSHRMGRIEHGRFGEQTGADPERVAVAKERLELVYCEMNPGDALYFHGNTLHSSDPNTSPHPRWGMLCCYDSRANDPYKESHHPRYTPLLKVPDTAIKAIGAKVSPLARNFSIPRRIARRAPRRGERRNVAGILRMPSARNRGGRSTRSRGPPHGREDRVIHLPVAFSLEPVASPPLQRPAEMLRRSAIAAVERRFLGGFGGGSPAAAAASVATTRPKATGLGRPSKPGTSSRFSRRLIRISIRVSSLPSSGVTNV